MHWTNSNGSIVTDKEILDRAKVVAERLRNQKRLASFEEKTEVMIRWDNQGAKFGESYTSITVPREAVAEAVRAHFKTIT